MFVISQFALHKSNMCKFNNISTYAIASGLIIYASIYLYLLFYNNDYVALFNKFIIYIIGIDLLLSTFYYFNTSKKPEPEQEPQSHNLNFEKNPNVELLNVPNVINVSSVSNDDSDEESISNDEESDFEIEETEDYDMEEITKTEILEENVNTEQLQTVDTEQLQTVDTEQLQQTLEKINSEETKQGMQKKVQRLNVGESNKINLSEKKLLDLESEQVIKKKRGRKPNHSKIQGV